MRMAWALAWLVLAWVVLGGAAEAPRWSLARTGVDSNLRGVSVVPAVDHGSGTIWATGSHGAILRSTDAGRTWARLGVPQGEALDFRGVQAIDKTTAYVMSSGEGRASRIYKTLDGGKTWELEYTDPRKEFFLDAIACVDAKRCLALSDPVDGKFLLLETRDGKTWSELPQDGMPAALQKEGAFAASNSALAVTARGEIRFATGGPAARVFRSMDWGKTWNVAETPIRGGTASAGIFSIFVKGRMVIAVGGDYQNPAATAKTAAVSRDGGKTWELATAPPSGFRSAVEAYEGGFVAVGPNGSDLSRDGMRWEPAEKVNLNALCFSGGEGWGVGAEGMVAQWSAK